MSIVKENTCNLQLKDLNKQLLPSAGILQADLTGNSTQISSELQPKRIQILQCARNTLEDLTDVTLSKATSVLQLNS